MICKYFFIAIQTLTARNHLNKAYYFDLDN